MSGYIGTQPVPQATQTRDSFTATSGQTSFATGGYTPNFLDVYLNGVKLASADYTASNGSDVVLASGAATGDILEVVAFTTFNSASSSIDDNGNATAITIDSSENVQFGTTQTFPAFNNVVGCEVGGFGQISASRDGAEAMQLNRKSSDGDIAKFLKDGSTVGSIGVVGSDILFLANPDGTGCGLNFDGDNPKINPTNGSGSGTNGVADLGWSGGRFKDAYLSGGVYLGGTGSANKLEDYEEGTFTPGILNGYGILNPTYSTNAGFYTKVGNIVHIAFRITLSGGSTNANGLRLVGLPFTVGATTNVGTMLNGWFATASSNATNVFLGLEANDLYQYFYYQNSNGTSNFLGTDAGTGFSMTFSGTYQTS